MVVAVYKMAYSDIKRRTVKITLPSGPMYNLSDFEDWAKEKHLEPEDFVAAGPMRASNIWQFTFTDVDCVERVLQDVEVKIAGKVGRISHVGERFVDLRIHWLPFYIEDGEVIRILERYGTVLSFRYSKPSQGLDSDFFKEVNGLTRLVQLRTDTPLEDLPYMLRLSDGDEEATGLVVIRGRRPKCFRCGDIGHERRECSASFCSVCRAYHMPKGPSEICSGPTYAAAMMRSRVETSRREEQTQRSQPTERTNEESREEGERENSERQEGAVGTMEETREETREVTREGGEKEVTEENNESGNKEDNSREQVEPQETVREDGDQEMPLGSSLPCHNAEDAELADEREEGQVARLLDLVKDRPYEPAYDPMLETSMDSETSSVHSAPSSPPRKFSRSK